jgi:ubiquinone/menaquinone biosynthesis C-methylase UbiE
LNLDVGCGQAQRGDVNVDVHRVMRRPGTDFIVASASNLPFKSRVFESVYCYHVLEHLENPFAALKELIRVSFYYVECAVPYGNHPYSHIDTDHKSFFTEAWFKKALAQFKCGYGTRLRLDNERPIYYLPIEILVQVYKPPQK